MVLRTNNEAISTMKVFRATQDKGWTKASIYDQLDRDEGNIEAFTAKDIPDGVAQEWVEGEYELRNDMLGEEAYIDAVIELNKALIRKVKRSL